LHRHPPRRELEERPTTHSKTGKEKATPHTQVQETQNRRAEQREREIAEQRGIVDENSGGGENKVESTTILWNRQT
jgi:hypothetical protein